LKCKTKLFVFGVSLKLNMVPNLNFFDNCVNPHIAFSTINNNKTEIITRASFHPGKLHLTRKISYNF